MNTNTNNDPFAQPEQKKKKFFNGDSRKIAYVANILISSLTVLGLGGLCLAHLLAPPLFLLSLPSAISIIFQVVLKYAPGKLIDVKKLLIEKMKKEKDKNVIEQTYQDVISNYDSLTGRSISLPSARDNEGDVTQRIPVHFVYNTKTGEYEPSIQNDHE